MTLRVTDHAAASDVGRVRRANEDSYFVRAPLFVVADGMGGAQAGEVASKIAAEAFATELDESLSPERRLAEVVRRANREIHDRSAADPDLQGMGTTLTAALVGDGELTLAHVGDSRAYRLRGDELTRLTTDHSLVGEMVRRGAISEAEAERHPQRSILTRALGPEREVEVDTISYGVGDGDVYVLCSDGLTTMLDDAQIAAAAGSGKPMREIAEQLIALANAAGGVDNITVVAFTVGGTTGARRAAGPSSRTAEEDAGSTVVAPAVVPETAAGGGGYVAPSPISPGAAVRARTRGRRRLLGVGLAVLVLLLATVGAVVASLNVYFLGVDAHGLVTVYRGLPYEGPFELKLYTRDYVSTVPAESLPPQRRTVLLDHTLRTRSDAIDLITSVERGEPAAIDRDAALGRDRVGATEANGAR